MDFFSEMFYNGYNCSKRQKFLDFWRLLAPTACRKAALFLIRSRVHTPQGYRVKDIFNVVYPMMCIMQTEVLNGGSE